MFDKIKEKLEQIAKEAEERIAQFEDEIAEQTEWKPLKRGGQNFGSHKLSEVGPNRLEFKATLGGKFFSFIFILAGCLLFYLSVNTMTVSIDQIFQSNEWLPLAGGLVFFGIGVVFFYSLTTPIVFDKEKQMFWKSRKAPERYSSAKNLKEKNAPLRDIHALQILSERLKGNSGRRSSRSYELNLIFKDASRLNVLDHGNRTQLLEDAEKLASFLDVPVWNFIRD